MRITDIKATIWCNNYILKYLYNHYSLKNLHCCPKSAFSDLKIVLDDWNLGLEARFSESIILLEFWKAISSLSFSGAPLKNVGNHKKSGIPAPLRDARSKNLKFVASFQFLEGTPKISPRAAHILLNAPQLGQNLYRVAIQ